MKIWILSDIHLEHSGLDTLDIPVADVCVVAGDLQNRGIVASLRWLDERVARHMPTVFVAGNHEYYRAEHTLLDEVMWGRSYEGSGQIHFLEDSFVEIGDYLFLGATLWTDFDILGPEWSELAMRKAAAEMNDYRLIKFQKQPYMSLSPVHTYRKHVLSRRTFENVLAAYSDKQIVIVSHHAPSLRSVEDRYLHDILTPSFASDMEDLMTRRALKLWIHGHVHHPVDYMVGGTRIIANPRGYPKEACYENYDFNFVIEL